MKFRQLEAFRCIMAVGTMRGAAEIMSVTQPAISRLIADLEIHLGFRLFDRERGTLKPTREGLQFYEYVEEQFLGLERLENAAGQIRRQGQSLRIVATHTLASTLIPPALKLFRQRFPDRQVLLRSHRLVQLVVRLQNMSVDLAVAAQLPTISNVRRTRLGVTRQVCILPRGHRLCDRAYIEPEDLRGEHLISILPDGPADWNYVSELLQAKGVPIRQSYEIDTSFACYAMVSQGLAIAVVEPFAARVWRGHDIVVRPFHPPLETHVYSAKVARSSFRPELEYFEKCLLAEAKHCPEFIHDTR